LPGQSNPGHQPHTPSHPLARPPQVRERTLRQPSGARTLKTVAVPPPFLGTFSAPSLGIELPFRRGQLLLKFAGGSPEAHARSFAVFASASAVEICDSNPSRPRRQAPGRRDQPVSWRHQHVHPRRRIGFSRFRSRRQGRNRILQSADRAGNIPRAVRGAGRGIDRPPVGRPNFASVLLAGIRLSKSANFRQRAVRRTSAVRFRLVYLYRGFPFPSLIALESRHAGRSVLLGHAAGRCPARSLPASEVGQGDARLVDDGGGSGGFHRGRPRPARICPVLCGDRHRRRPMDRWVRGRRAEAA
jgi:hypothetical protein